ncbi:MAG: ABC transporter ATP-binding protein [Polyangiaceae bacterium]
MNTTPSVLGVVTRTAGARAAARALPVFIGLLVGAAVLFGPTGVQPSDVGRAIALSFPLRVAAAAAWFLIATPLARLVLADRRGDFLRALPRTRLRSFVAVVSLLVLLQLPSVLFWGAARGAGAALVAVVLGAGVTAVLASGRTTLVSGAALLGSSLVIGLDARPALALLLTPALLGAVYEAWLHAPERAVRSGARVRGSLVVALALAHGLRLARVERVRALAALSGALVGGALAALAVRNGGHLGTDGESAVFFGVAALPLVVAMFALAGVVRDADDGLDVILRSGGARVERRVLARVLTLGACGGLLGVALFVGARASVPVSTSFALSAPLMGFVVAALVVGVEVQSRAPRKTRASRDESGRVFGGALAAILAVTVLSAMLGAIAIAVLGALGAGLVVARNVPLSFSKRGGAREPDGCILSVDGVRKRFEGKIVLESASLAIEPGVVAVLRGENGSGKSTLLRIVAGLLEPDAGAIVVAGASLARERSRALRSIGYAPDATELPDHLSVEELLHVVAALREVSLADFSEEIVELGVDRLLRERLSALSLGQRRRVAIASALTGSPALLVMDEPTNGLDAGGLATLERILERQRSRGFAALVATHEVGFAAKTATTTFQVVAGAVVADATTSSAGSGS